MSRINVTKTFLPDIDLYKSYIDRIWGNCHLTNQGPFLTEMETKLKKYFGVEYLHFIANGTIAIQVAMRALRITQGEVITTPFSYVATTSSILWERCVPVFVDIDPYTFCINADEIEKAITPKTKAILAVHVFGYPCDVVKIEKIAKNNNLKVIYDAAHVFGARYLGKSLIDYGDASTCSFHATKVFHTIEGGCVVIKNKDLSNQINLIKSFGHTNDNHHCLGINAKASEFQAAMGLCNLDQIKYIIMARKQVSNWYDEFLRDVVQRPKIPVNFEYNYAYYPVVFKNEATCLEVISCLNKQNIFPRRYFYPSLNTLPYMQNSQSCPISEDISSRILCLPLYVGLGKESVETISKIIHGALFRMKKNL